MAPHRLDDATDNSRSAGWVRLCLLMPAIVLLLVAGVLAVVRAMDVEPPYILDREGAVKPAPVDGFGIPYEDARFLSNMSGALMAGNLFETSAPKADLRHSLTAGYRAQGHALSKYHRFESDRERLIAYLMLRVNGSLPIYNPALVVPGDLPSLLSGSEGNCGMAATRLLAVLESFSIPARAIIWYSPALQGHIFVDVYDPVENKAYLLDPTFNLWSKFDDVKQGYLDVLAGMTIEKRRRYLKNGLVSFPFFFVEPVNMVGNPNDFRQEQSLRRQDALYSALTYELPFTLDHWKKNYPLGAPFNLANASSRFRDFGPDHVLSTASLLGLAGITPGKGGSSTRSGNSVK